MTATVHSLGEQRAPSLDPLVALVAADMNAVNAVILDRMQSTVALIPELAGHLIAGGGKRLRPMLTLASATLLGYPGTRHHRLAAAVEFIHTATLLHDDVVDLSEMRRGKRTANLIWGNPASVLVGDFLFSRAFAGAAEKVGAEGTGLHDGDVDAEGSEFCGERFGEALDGELGGVVITHARGSDEAPDGGQIENVAAALGAEMGKEGASDTEEAEDVGLEHGQVLRL